MLRRLLPYLIVLAAFGLRTWGLTDVPPGLTHDEADHGHDAAAILKGVDLIYFPVGYGREPAFDYFNAGLIAVVGDRPFTLRFSAVVWSLITLAATYRAARLAVNKLTAILAMGFMAAAFWPMVTARQILRSDMLPAEMALAVIFYLCLARAREFSVRRRLLAAAGLGLSVAASLYTYIPSRVLWSMFVIAWLVDAVRNLRAGQSLRGAWSALVPVAAALLLAAALASPLFMYLRQNPEVEQRIGMLSQPLQAAMAGNFRPILDNIAAVSLALFVPGRGDSFLAYNLPGRALTDPLTGLLTLVGLSWLLIASWQYVARPDAAASPGQAPLLTAWLALGLAPALITGPEALTTRLIGAQPVMYMLPALAINAFWPGLRARWQQPRSSSPKAAAKSSKMQPLRWPVAALAAALIILAGYNAYDYLVTWANLPELRAAYRSTTVAMLGAANAASLVSTQLPLGPHDPAIGELLTSSPTRWMDARYAIILRAGDAEAWQLLAPASAAPHPFFQGFLRQRLKVDLRPNDLDPFYVVYQVSAFKDKTPDAARPVLNGALALRSAQWLAGSYVPGTTAEFLTAWQVLDAGRLGTVHPSAYGTDLKLFTHVLDSSGGVFAQQDRLDAPSWDWQTGDTVLQIHQFSIPADARPGSYPVEIGVYDQPTGERLIEDGSGASALPAPPLIVKPR